MKPRHCKSSMKKHALVIGINQYKRPLRSLNCAVRDAQGIAGVLRKTYGFNDEELTLMTCDHNSDAPLFPSRENILEQLNSIPKGELDCLLIFFSGHGFGKLDPKGNYDRYLCPVGTDRKNLPLTGISFHAFFEAIGAIGAMDTCLILDCCQNMPIPGAKSADTVLSKDDTALMERYTKDVQAAFRPQVRHNPTTALITSCSADQCAYEWEEKGYGIFTAHLLAAMRKSARVTDWIGQIRNPVYDKARELHHDDQHPYLKIEGSGDIHFLDKPVIDTKKLIAEAQAEAANARAEAAEAQAEVSRIKQRAEEAEKKIIEIVKKQEEDAWGVEMPDFSEMPDFVLPLIADYEQLEKKQAEAAKAKVISIPSPPKIKINKLPLIDTKVVGFFGCLYGILFGVLLGFIGFLYFLVVDGSIRWGKWWATLDIIFIFGYCIGSGLVVSGLFGWLLGLVIGLFVDKKRTKAHPYINRGNTYFNQGAYDLAIADYNKAIQIEPDSSHAYYLRGSTHSIKGDYDLAFADSIEAGYAAIRKDTYEKKGMQKEAEADRIMYEKLKNQQ